MGEGEGEESMEEEATWQPVPLRFDDATPPVRLYHFSHQFRNPATTTTTTTTTTRAKMEVGNNKKKSYNNNFLKGVKWSPDGSCFLTADDHNSLRLFYLPQDVYTTPPTSIASTDEDDSYNAGLIIKEAEPVYDYCWYPYMSASDPTGCVFASTTRDHPIHLWDAITGELRCTYRAYDAMDEVTAALSVSFNSFGNKLFAGYNKMLRVFDVHRPGRDFEQYSLSKRDEGTAGLVSSICFSPAQNGMFALGSYNQTTSVYDENTMEALYVLHGQQGGVTQVLFSKDGNYLYTGGRKDPFILCWDIRNTADILYKLYRSAESTNQRIAFDIEPCGRHLGTGGQDGLVHIYDLQSGQWVTGFQAATDTVNGFTFHPYLPLAASSSGHRRFDTIDDDSDESSPTLAGDENCCSIWMFPSTEEMSQS